jgi:hypothetical protein
LADSGGGHKLRGGMASSVSPINGKKELKRTAGASAEAAVACSHSSARPSCDIAEQTAEKNASL